MSKLFQKLRQKSQSLCGSVDDIFLYVATSVEGHWKLNTDDSRVKYDELAIRFLNRRLLPTELIS